MNSELFIYYLSIHLLLILLLRVSIFAWNNFYHYKKQQTAIEKSSHLSYANKEP